MARQMLTFWQLGLQNALSVTIAGVLMALLNTISPAKLTLTVLHRLWSQHITNRVLPRPTMLHPMPIYSDNTLSLSSWMKYQRFLGPALLLVTTYNRLVTCTAHRATRVTRTVVKRQEMVSWMS